MNEYADVVYGSEKPKGESESAKLKEEEIEDELTKEMEELKKKQAAPVSERRFQNVITGIKGCMFIRSTVRMCCWCKSIILTVLFRLKIPQQ